MSLAVAAARRAGVRDSVAASPRDDDDGVDDHGDRNGLEDYGHGAVAHREESSGSAPPTSIMPLDMMIMMHVQVSSTSASQFLATHRRCVGDFQSTRAVALTETCRACWQVGYLRDAAAHTGK
eukprot:SAG25_NODE_722_length_5726_cov_289.638415_9_plen_123_part_00